MKIIFSRKGFDSSAGGFPSLIFPDGTLFSIPIPSSKDACNYSDLSFNYEGDSIQSILNDVSGGKIRKGKHSVDCDYLLRDQQCHHDPMHFQGKDFIGIALGQANGTESHLRNQSVGKGDVFLFYGWFKKIERHNGKWNFILGEPDIHLIWSSMLVGDCVKLDTDNLRKTALDKYPFLSKHPHLYGRAGVKNRIYLSKQHRYFTYDPKRCLTDMENYKGRATWRLPKIFNQPQAFSFLKNFVLNNNDVVISYRGYGQEFVLNMEQVTSQEDKTLIMDYIENL